MADLNRPLEADASLSDQYPRADDRAGVLPPLSLLDVIALLLGHIKLLVLLPLCFGLLAAGLTYLKTPVYTATVRILPPQQQNGVAAMFAQQLGSLAGIAGAAAGIKNPADQYVSMLRGRTITDGLIKRFELKSRYETEFAEQTRKAFENRTEITAGVKDAIISISVEDQDPKIAAEIANAFVDELSKLTRSLALTEASSRRAFFEKELLKSKDRLASSEGRLRESGVSPSVMKAEPRIAVEAVARVSALIASAEVKLGMMRSVMSSTNPDLRLAEQELVALRAQLAQLDRKKTAAAGESSDSSDYVARYRDFKYSEVLFELMAKQYEMAKVDEARDSTVVQIVDIAVPPERKSGPKRGIIAIVVTAASLLLTLVFVFIRDWLRREKLGGHSTVALDQIAANFRRKRR
jgi:tyrosine-protein kinase Etk/Wzc